MVIKYNFKEIHVVPDAKAFVDIVLSRVQRKTPTVVHARYQIARIRQFYMRKVKFTQQQFHIRLSELLEDFPRLDDIHPFYADLINVLYDKDHYKLALGQLNVCRHLIDNLAKDYVKLLKYGDSLYRCKQLKRAALGRMSTLMLKQDASLKYLEQVRQHLSRLPSIDPNTRTLLLTGYPNAGKSSFINKVSRADVEVQPYAFTTKSLYVGHMDYKYLRWQVIDTPGIFDQPLEDRNTIEMQAVTALAHLHCAVLFMLDISGQGEYSVAEQCGLFQSLQPLFAQKPVLLVCNKTDVRTLDQLQPEERNAIAACEQIEGVRLMQMSNKTEEGIVDVKSLACDLLLEQRVQQKLQGKKLNTIANRIHIARPQKRDNKTRAVHIPESVIRARQAKKSNANRDIQGNVLDAMDLDEETRRLLRHTEEANGGAGVYHYDWREEWRLPSGEEFQFDRIPETFLGKNVADFIDPDIDARLEALEREEQEQLQQEALLKMEGEFDEDELDADEKLVVDALRAKKKIIRGQAFVDKTEKARVPRSKKSRSFDKMDAHLRDIGIDTTALRSRARSVSRAAGVKRGRSDSMDVDMDEDAAAKRVRTRSMSRAPSKAPRGVSFKDETAAVKAKALEKKSLKNLKKNKSFTGRTQTASDRFIGTKRPKHLYSGKRGIGKTDRR